MPKFDRLPVTDPTNGKVPVHKPRGLVAKCKEIPNNFGKATLARLRRGLPPFHLKKGWPTGDECMFRKLVVKSMPNSGFWENHLTM